MNKILQFDNFAPDAATVRETVTSGPFSTQQGPDGAEYTGISAYPVPHWVGLIERNIGKKIVPGISCFRLNLAGELPHSWVHSDNLCSAFASVLYLNTDEQCVGGTAFWKHKSLGIDFLPTKEVLNGLGINGDVFYEQMNEDWKKLSLWQQTRLVEMKFNRFITYPTCMFHSRFPFEAFGSGPEDGRLIWICFYDVVEGVE